MAKKWPTGPVEGMNTTVTKGSLCSLSNSCALCGPVSRINVRTLTGVTCLRDPAHRSTSVFLRGTASSPLRSTVVRAATSAVESPMEPPAVAHHSVRADRLGACGVFPRARWSAKKHATYPHDSAMLDVPANPPFARSAPNAASTSLTAAVFGCESNTTAST